MQISNTSPGFASRVVYYPPEMMGLLHPSPPGMFQTRLHSQTPWILRPDISSVQFSFPRSLPGSVSLVPKPGIFVSLSPCISGFHPLSVRSCAGFLEAQLLHRLEYFPVKGAYRGIKIFLQGPDPMIDSVSVFRMHNPIYLSPRLYSFLFLLIYFFSLRSACFTPPPPRPCFPVPCISYSLRLSDRLASRNRRIDDDLPDLCIAPYLFYKYLRPHRQTFFPCRNLTEVRPRAALSATQYGRTL